MKIEEIYDVLRRGYVYVVTPEEGTAVNLDCVLKKGDAEFAIVGVEMAAHVKHIGLVLFPIFDAHREIKVGDEVEIKRKSK